MRLWPNGLAEILGDTLAIGEPLYVSGDVWFVNSATGTDAASPAGKDKEKPLAGLAQAITNAAAGDLILLAAGHTQTLTAAIAVSKQLFIVGGGSSGGSPTVSFTMNSSAADTFTISAAGCDIRNIKFPESSQTNAGTSGAKVVVSNVAGTRIVGCRFEMGAKDNYAGVMLVTSGADTRLSDCTFISTATSTATRPSRGVNTNSLALSDFEVTNCVFSDGTVGFANGAFDGSGGIMTRFRGINNSLLLGADMKMNSSSTGYLVGTTTTGAARVDWT